MPTANLTLAMVAVETVYQLSDNRMMLLLFLGTVRPLVRIC